MAIPIINTTTSVLGYKQWDSWEYQPFATETPTSWDSSALPPGMSFDGTTGLLSGAVTSAGVFIVGITATNGDGTSAPVDLTIGIEAAPGSPSVGIDVTVELATGLVTFPGGVFSVKEDDDLLFNVQFVKSGTVVDLGDLVTLDLALKELEEDPAFVIGGDFAKLGDGSTASYELYLSIESDALKAIMTNYEADAGTLFTALAAIMVVFPNPSDPTVGPDNYRRETQTFSLPIVRNLNPE